MIAGLRIGTENLPQIGGVLGNDILRSRILQIDYPRRRLRLLRDAPPTPPGALVRPMKYVDGSHVPMLEDVVTVNGKNVPATLDTGAYSAITIGTVTLAAREITLSGRPGPIGSNMGRLGNLGLAQFVLLKP